VRLFVGDDWAENHHDVEVMSEAGKVLAKARLPEGVAGMTRLHELVGRYLGEDAEGAEAAIGIETDRGPWVTALVAAGYVVYPVNPLQASVSDFLCAGPFRCLERDAYPVPFARAICCGSARFIPPPWRTGLTVLFQG